MSNPPRVDRQRKQGLRERLALNEADGEYRDGAIRYLVMRPDVLMGAFAGLPAGLRDIALESLAQSALKFGGRSVQSYRDSGATNATELLRVMTVTSAQLGWGRWTFVHAEDGRSLQLIVRNSPFAAGFGAGAGPVCHAIRGIFTALAPVVFGSEVATEETQCAAEVSGDTCHFLMRPR